MYKLIHGVQADQAQECAVVDSDFQVTQAHTLEELLICLAGKEFVVV